MRFLKYWYYGTLFLVFEFLFRVTLNWSTDWDKVARSHQTASYYLRKQIEHSR